MLISLLHNLPDFKGKRRITKWLFADYIKNKRDAIVNGVDKMRFQLPNVIETIGFEILVNGVYEKETSDFIISRLPANGVFLDLGANIGAIAFPVCKKRPDITALCIEASPRVFEYLKKNKELNQVNNCTLINKAIGEKDGELVGFYSPQEQFGKGSLSSVFTDKPEYVESITVNRLIEAESIKEVDFIKIDVEGYEYHAFKGADRLLTGEKAPDILFEFVDWAEELAKDVHPGDAQKLLRDYGYQLYNFSNGTLIKQDDIIIKGSAMFFASKKRISN